MRHEYSGVFSDAASGSEAGGETLSGNAVLDALKMILVGAPLAEVLTSVTRLIETQRPGMLCSIFILDADGVHLRYAAAPNLPEFYRSATDGLASGPKAGSCGTAVYSMAADCSSRSVVPRNSASGVNNPPNCPPTSVLLVLKLKFYTKIFALYSRR
jgi:hypothetical protein